MMPLFRCKDRDRLTKARPRNILVSECKLFPPVSLRKFRGKRIVANEE